jgi:ABC-type multidrug transport system fused ATPase/permease subunit
MLRELMTVQGSLQVFGTVAPGADRFENFMAEAEAGLATRPKLRPTELVGAGVAVRSVSPAEVTLREVGFRYQEQFVLKGIREVFPAAKVTAIVGESGAGKSTLVDLILGVLTPTEGEVRISQGSRVGYVPQESVLFEGTVRENLTLWGASVEGQRDVQDQGLWEALRAAGAEAFVRDLPGQLEARVGERGVRLSGGQRQRLCIARELVRRPGLLVLDEATSALDSESEQVIQSTIRALRGAVTIVLIAHRLATVREADQILVLDRGRVVERGTFSELSQAGGRFRRMVDLQDLRADSQQEGLR